MQKVDRILWMDWDPIGVNDDPGATGEYAPYASQIIRLILDGADAHKIYAHLLEIETVYMGIRSPDEPRMLAAKKLTELELSL